ncbi:phospho-sugar mutase [Emergencia sp.]|uniref:phospho-sugar mutase n=1 Tax=Emergencia sp. TaxID=1926557 RepID=UPI003AF0EF24
MNKNEIREYANSEYRRWLEKSEGDIQLQQELKQLADNEEERIDSFYTDLRFGTSGIRGIIGAGTNRMNEYVVRRTTQGLADYLNAHCKKPSIVIAYDSRKKSKVFALETARTLRGNDIEVFLFPEIAPVSLLSYAIGRLHCSMGIMITASHNPKIFNGYKVYNQNGYQIVGEEAEQISEAIDQLDYFEGIKVSEEGISCVDQQVCDDFIAKIASFSLLSSQRDILNKLSVVYTPLNGAGNRYVRQVLSDIGFENLTMVPAQENPDENFATCPTPNPEKITAYTESFKILDQIGGDVIIATDPDSDRVGLCLLYDDMKVLLTGNQLGILIFDYLCQMRKPLPGQVVIKSIVSTPLIEKMAEKYGLQVINTLTGFKYIGELITALSDQGQEEAYFFGFEESNGYLVDPFIRDKDGVSSAMIAVEMAAYHKAQGKNLIERLLEIYEEFGTCRDKTRNYFFEGPYGAMAMKSLMNHFRREIDESIGGRRILKKKDYMKATGLPKADVVEFILEGGARFIIRPSGTEAKIKVYLFETENNTKLEKAIENIVETYKEI